MLSPQLYMTTNTQFIRITLVLMLLNACFYKHIIRCDITETLGSPLRGGGKIGKTFLLYSENFSSTNPLVYNNN